MNSTFLATVNFRSAELFGLPSMGTPLLQQITLRDDGVLKEFKIRVTSGLDIFHEIEGK